MHFSPFSWILFSILWDYLSKTTNLISWLIESKVGKHFSLKGQRVNIRGFLSHANLQLCCNCQLCHCSIKATISNIWTTRYVCVPIKLYLKKQRVAWIWSTNSFPTVGSSWLRIIRLNLQNIAQKVAILKHLVSELLYSLKIIEAKNIYLCGLYSLAFIVVEIKTEI